MSASELDRALHASVLKREAWKEKEWREKKAKVDEELHLGFGATEMGKESLKKVIDGDRRMYYRTEELNDKLYIHYKGWKEIRGLENWTGLRALYAECNAFDRIQGLQNCRSLRSLFLQENCIRRIDGLENCPLLWNLNLSNNFIERIEGLSHLRGLNTLTIAKNKIGLKGVDDLAELANTTISSLDIQDNLIWDPDIMPEVLMRMTELRVLYLKGNPCTKRIPNYRKTTTVCCEDLRYLDDRPVFAEDRRAADAFNRGGLEEERAERRRIREENNDKHTRNMKAFSDMIENARREKRERDAMRLEDKFTDETDPVESFERRMKRQLDTWKEDHKDEIKDDMKEHAERCLREEKEGKRQAPEQAPEKAPEQAPEEAPELAPEEAPEVTEASAADESSDQAEEAEKAKDRDAEPVKEDNRKLVYEDIWDDEPSTDAPAAATEQPFLPWASGSDVSGMDDLPASMAELAKRAAGLRDAAARHKEQQEKQGSQAGVDSTAESTPAWYSKFSEKAHAQTKQELISEAASAPTFAPPPRVGKADPALPSELDEMD